MGRIFASVRLSVCPICLFVYLFVRSITQKRCALILLETSALYKLFTYLLTYLLTKDPKVCKRECPWDILEKLWFWVKSQRSQGQ